MEARATEMTFKFSEPLPIPYKTVVDYVIHSIAQYKYDLQAKIRDGFWPCPNCEGYKKAYRSEDRDPYEGWKMATMYPCHVCAATGEMTELYWRGRFKIDRAARLATNKELRARKELQTRALSKLSLDERHAIGIWLNGER